MIKSNGDFWPKKGLNLALGRADILDMDRLFIKRWVFRLLGMGGILMILTCAHTGPPVYSEEERKLASELEKEAIEYQEYLKKHPEKDIQKFNYSDAWMAKQEIRLERITNRICQANKFEVPELEIDPGIYCVWFEGCTRVINAATNGSLIFVTAAMMKLLEDDSELATVIGHELGHIHRKHITKRILRTLPFAIITSIIDAHAPGVGDGVSLIGNIALAKFNRDEERESDVWGVVYIKKAKFDYHKSPNVWRRMAILDAERLGRSVYFGDSHPFHPERLIRLQKVVKDLDLGEDPIKKYLPEDEWEDYDAEEND